MRWTTLLLVLALPLVAKAEPETWKPARGPLLTRWASEVKPDRVLPEYPRPQMVRKEWLNLNGLWEFSAASSKGDPTFGTELARRILVPFPVESALSGIMESHSHVWYRRMFTVPAAWQGKRILLHFGAVNWDSAVYVNGKKLAAHQGGYDPFQIDITDALNKEGPQELFVTAHNPIDAGTQPRGKQVRKPGGIFYTACTGIWQTVWLEPVPAARIERVSLVPDLDKSRVLLRLSSFGEIIDPTLHWVVRAGDKVVSSGKSQGRGRRTPGWIWKKVQAGEKLAADKDDAIEDHSISLENPRLWSPESPFLHDVTVTLTDGDKTLDSVQTYFGMRKTSLGKDDKGVTRLFLNNKPYFQVGLLDQGFWPDGIYTAPTDAALRYDIEFTRKLGFNVARKHVKVEPARWYHWCDKLGLLVWQDMPSGDASVGPGQGEIKRGPDAARQFERELSRMIESLAAFPSIVMWVPFNEGWGQYDTPRIVDLVRKLDPTRLVNNASGWNDMKCGDVHDFHVYPGPGSPRPEENRAAVLGEFGGLGLSTPGHMWTKEFWGYRGVRDKADLTSKYVKLLQGVYRLKENPGLSACIYTQTTDVETEANGLITYDRAVIKVDVDRVAAANRGDFTGVVMPTTLVATSQDEGKSWRYTLDQPPAGWNQPDFKDDDWKQGEGGFGTPGTPGGAIRTTWKTPTIWMRREFTLDRLPKGEILAIMHHDEDAEVFINGVPALDVKGFTTDYEEFPIDARAAKSLRVGKNLISVRCRQTGGGQYIDVGLAEIPPRSK